MSEYNTYDSDHVSDAVCIVTFMVYMNVSCHNHCQYDRTQYYCL